MVALCLALPGGLGTFAQRGEMNDMSNTDLTTPAGQCVIGSPERDWSRASLTELVDHIESEHHGYLREELPRLSGLIEKLVETHGGRHSELLQCRQVFDSLRRELEPHMAKEEQILFPMIRDLDASSTLPDFHCGSLRNPIRVMELEHDDASLALLRLRELTADYTPPGDACSTHRAAFAGLAALEADLHRHIHKETDILFPRAVAEEALKPRS